MVPEEERERGISAARLLADPLLQEAFATIRIKLEDLRDGSQWNESDLREHIHQKLSLLKKVREYLENTVRTGNFAVQKLETMKKRSSSK